MRQQLAVQSSAMEAVSLILEAKETAINPMVTTLWSLWTNRNAIREDGRGRKDEELARSIRIYAHECSQPQRLPSPQ